VPGPLDGVALSVAKSLIEQFGQQVVLRTPEDSYAPATGTRTETNTDRTVWGLIQTSTRTDAQGVVRRMTTLLLPAEGLYVDGLFRVPKPQDTVVVGADIFGDDDNPGWTDGKEYLVAEVEEEWANQEIYAYTLVLDR